MKRLSIYMTLGILCLTSSVMAAPANVIHLEAEDGQLTGTVIAKDRAGFTGKGYVTGFNVPTYKLEMTIPNARAGLYDVKIRYSAPLIKGYELVVNGSHYSGMFAPHPDGFAEQDAGNVMLNAGTNTVEIQYGWGHYDIDSLDFIPTRLPRLASTNKTPTDPLAIPATHELYAYLQHEYGKETLSGQYDQSENQYIQTVSGKLPAIIGADFSDYSPSRIEFGANPNGITERQIAAAKAGQIVTMVWHWNAPTDLINKMETDSKGNPVNHLWYRGFYTEATTFDLEKAVDNPASPDYALLLRDIDAISIQVQKFQDAGVPVLWRPLHEAEGGWFWWGAKGPEPFKKLWRLMYDRMTNYHHLHNLIWVYSSGTDPAWYPGDQYVDVVGIDEYPQDVTDPESSAWNTLQSEYGGRKLVALREFGGVPDIPKMQQLGPRWAYFVSWTGDVGPRKMTKDALTQIYTSSTVVTKDKLPVSRF